MEFDLIVKGGVVVDGTGAPRYDADIGVRDGRIVAIGALHGTAARIIDASGLIVAPGFIDPHTHYDAQIFWDGALTPSPWHGVTTVLAGNCGVGVAPCRPADREVTMSDLVNVESIPEEVLRAGLPWNWETFPQYLDAVSVRPLAVNIAFLAPLTPLRQYVMGAEAMKRSATTAETAAIKALIGDAVDAGAFGFSTTQLPNHIGNQGVAVGCRNASDDELVAYATALREQGKGLTQIAVTKKVSMLADDEYTLLDRLLTASERPLTWLSLVHRSDFPSACDDTLEKAAPLIRRGALPQITPRAMTREINMRNPFSFAGFPVWHSVFNQPLEKQREIYADPAFREQFRKELKNGSAFSGNWNQVSVLNARSPALQCHERRTVAAIAREWGKDGVDTLLDLTLADNLDIEFGLAFLNTDDDAVAALLRDSRNIIGLSDGGAHVDILCDAGYCTYLLGKWVREKKVLTIEQGVRRMTTEPANLLGLSDRGRLAVGAAADIAIFDADTVGSDEHGEKRFDLPGGARRIVIQSRGMAYTIVNGMVAFENGQMTGKTAGKLLRSH